MKPKRHIAALLVTLVLCSGIALAAANGAPADPGPAKAKRAGKDYAPFPQPDAGYVTDLADLLTDEQEQKLERRLLHTETKTKVEIIVILIKSIKDYPGIPNKSIEEFATALFNKYGIGNLPKNDGVLLLIARKDRKARIELGAGYGRKRDADAAEIMQDAILPAFKKNRYAEGVTKGVSEIIREFAGIRINEDKRGRQDEPNP